MGKRKPLLKNRLRTKALSGDALDVHLMLELASGSEEAFRGLIERHEGALLNLFRRLGADQDEAEDVAQETFLRLFGYRERYRPEARFRTFLFTVARHAWLDYCRKRERWRRSDGQIPEEELAEASCRVSTSERMDLEAALGRLPPAHRMVLVLSAYEGLGYAEIGRIMEIPEGTVKSRVFHGLRKLRKELGADVELAPR